MTTNKTTALIEAAKRLATTYEATLTEYEGLDSAHNDPCLADIEKALAAFEQPTLRMVSAQCSCGKQMTVTQEYPVEQPAVREMSVEQFVEWMLNEAERGLYNYGLVSPRKMAYALAKLGTIRVVA